MVLSLEAVRKGRGQPRHPTGWFQSGAFAIGLQIDRHVTRALTVDLVGNVMVRAEANLPSNEPARGVGVILDLIGRVRARTCNALAPQSEDRIVGLGVAMPGPFGLDGFGRQPWMMPAWQKFPLLETLAVGTGLNVGLQNDAAACATAERLVGAAHGVDHAVCLYVGYGIGAGLILNGEALSRRSWQCRRNRHGAAFARRSATARHWNTAPRWPRSISTWAWIPPMRICMNR